MAVLKISFSLLLLYLVFDRIPFREVWAAAKSASPVYLLAALLLFIISKGIAAVRLNGYFHQVGLPLSAGSNLRLYALGMFYNLFLPGGIGGDAYKGYALKRAFGHPLKPLVSVLLLDRLSGLYVLFAFALVLLIWAGPEAIAPFRWALAALIPVGLGLYFVLHRRLFPQITPVFWKALGQSAGVQLSQVGAAYFIFLSLGIQGDALPYLLLFLASSIAAVLPITIGGIGSRELVFYYGAVWFLLEERTAVAISMLFFLITAAVSLCGIYYHFRKPVLVLEDGGNPKGG